MRDRLGNNESLSLNSQRSPENKNKRPISKKKSTKDEILIQPEE